MSFLCIELNRSSASCLGARAACDTLTPQDDNQVTTGTQDAEACFMARMEGRVEERLPSQLIDDANLVTSVMHIDHRRGVYRQFR